ncbi:MAG: DUF1330 domain-containing protein [Robiginitomaculum sp.]|nr:DUF1330 domain-containing protein [Robiginitomaculum sp.]MDQ7077425.1 DUF1330 domain-containing protein [Robiginitomaculum sp.]
MSAFFVATSTIKDPEKFAEYGAKAGASLAPYGGNLVIKGKAVTALAGTSNHQAVGIIRFADMEALNAWYQSPEYQALIPLRNEAVDMTLVTYEEPA